MLRFAFVVGLVGLVYSAAIALLAVARAPLAEFIGIYWVVFPTAFLGFFAAVLGHPARTASGSTVSVSLWQVARTARLWTSVLAGATFAAFFVVLSLSPPGRMSIRSSSDLVGRIDRQLLVAGFYAAVHAMIVMIASSGLRYWTALAPPPAPVATGAPIAAYSAPGPAPERFSYRVIDHAGWWQIALEVGAALFIWLQAKSFVLHSPGWLRHALLAVFLLPVVHVVVKLTGKITFALEGEDLVVRHFPFYFRNRRIRVRDINGIQVNPEHDRNGNQSHYSLIVIGLSLEADRIVHYLVDHEQAAALAQRIEATIAPARSASARRT